ncbi:MAG: T9SS type A sorting domain-containing protein [Saprospiraceae bacterium]|nr:T9SS type A sorting domain-containing protein [Saprospiraceae bacterium]
MTNFKKYLLCLSLSLLGLDNLSAQCASGVTYITKVTSTSGLGTYESPALGNIEFEFCFKLDEFFESQTNWVHGIFISFGDLQDGVVYELGESGEQNTQHGPRKWIYIDSVKAKQFKLPGVGFYVDDFDGNPRNNYGDNGNGTPKAKFPNLKPFCIKAKYTCGYPRILRPTFTVTGDGTSGGWSNPACPGDEFVSAQGGGNNTGYIVVCGTVLPLQLLSFYGDYSDQHNLLNWTGLADQFFSHYELERKVGNEREYTKVEQFVPSYLNNESGLHEIQYTDPMVAQNTTYYRLKMVEKNLSYSYSQIISISPQNNLKNKLKIRIYPQPIDQLLSVEWSSSSSELLYEIYSLDGKLCTTGILNSLLNNNTQDIFTQQLTKGSYFIRFIERSEIPNANLIPGNSQVFKFIKS